MGACIAHHISGVLDARLTWVVMIPLHSTNTLLDTRHTASGRQVEVTQLEVGVSSVVVCAAVRVDSNVHRGLKGVKVNVREQCQRGCRGIGPGDAARSASCLQGGPPSSDRTCIIHTMPHKHGCRQQPLKPLAMLLLFCRGYGNMKPVCICMHATAGSFQGKEHGNN